MANNTILHNAALAGACAGMAAGTGAAGANQAAALAFATDVDAAIPLNALLSTAVTGAALPPTTDAITADQYAATAILFGLCYAAWAGKGNPGATSAGAQTALVAQIAASWAAAFAVRVTP